MVARRPLPAELGDTPGNAAGGAAGRADRGAPSSPGQAQDPEAVLLRLADAHPAEIDLGLERLRRVAQRAGLDRVEVPLVIVAGTNGKGSTVAMLAAIWQAAGHRVGTSTSPHLERVNERMRIDGEPLDDESIVASLAAIEPHIGADTLTYFELATLAAMHAFRRARCHAIVLEVGLGGRLDAANLWDADCAVLTSIALDHADWLGTDLGVIATEKAAVGRRGRPLVIGEPYPPPTLVPFAAHNGIELVSVDPISVPVELGLAGEHQRRNAACAIAVTERLAARLPLTDTACAEGLRKVQVDGRLERRTRGGIEVVLDVAHNPHAATALAAALAQLSPGHRWHLVFAALGDKDIEAIAAALAPIAASFDCVPLQGARALSVASLASRVRAGLHTAGAMTCEVRAHDSLDAASSAAFERAARDRGGVLVAGSFLTVGGWRARFAHEAR